MTASTSLDRSVSDDALASGGAAGDGGFDPSKVENDREARMWLWRLNWHAPDEWYPVSSVTQMQLLLGANIYQLKRIGSDAVHCCSGTTTYTRATLDPSKFNTPIPAVPQTPSGDMAGEDDVRTFTAEDDRLLRAALTKSSKHLYDMPSAASPDGAGSGSEPVAWQIWNGAQWKFHNAAIHASVAWLRDNGTIVRPLYAAPPASADAVAVVTDYLGRIELGDVAPLSQYGQGRRAGMREAIDLLREAAALRARQHATEAQS